MAGSRERGILRPALVTALTVTLATAGAASATGAAGTGAAGTGAAGPDGDGRMLRTSAVFLQKGEPGSARAITYDRRVPEGARIQVGQKVRKDGKGMKIEVAVRGATPEYTYGMHVHTRPCGALPDSSGPHYQNRKDPKQPSTDTRFANPRNEVWLDFTSDKHGNGSAAAKQKWTFRKGEARSVVLHEHATSAHNGKAGTAGDRLACVTVPFGSGWD